MEDFPMIFEEWFMTLKAIKCSSGFPKRGRTE
jgi:hypothetical protein